MLFGLNLLALAAIPGGGCVPNVCTGARPSTTSRGERIGRYLSCRRDNYAHESRYPALFRTVVPGSLG